MDTTADSIIFPEIKICQPALGGFRFGCDSPLLAYFARIKKGANIADVGSGSGVIAALIAKIYGAKVTALEIQEEMFSCLKETVKLCMLENIVTPVLADIRQYRSGKPFDAVVCNPPYRKAGTGKVSGSIVERNARFSYTMGLEELVKFCKINMKYGGKLFFSYDADMLADAAAICRENNMEPKRLRLVYPSPDKPAKLMLMECVFGGGTELIIEPPLFQQGFGNEYDNIFKGNWSKSEHNI